MPTIELRGIVTDIREKEVISERLEKQSIILHVTERGQERNYENDYKVDFVNGRISLLDNIAIGQEIGLLCNLKGKNNKDRNFINIESYKLL